jgi:hypothetical protein
MFEIEKYSAPATGCQKYEPLKLACSTAIAFSAE